MGKGRKPISNELKRLQGTDQPSRMRDEISYEKITKIPAAPKWMNKFGKKVYKVIAAELAAKNILDVTNINAVVAYSQEYGKYIEAEEKLQEEGRVLTVPIMNRAGVEIGENKYRNPLDKMSSEYLANAKSWAVELGITPSSASRVKGEVKKEEDALGELMKM